MKKVIKAIVVILLAITLIVWLASFAFAKEVAPAAPAQSLTVAAVSLSDLGVSNPGLLPTNPFYFVKEWGRSLKQLITFDPVKKAELGLQVATEKAAELKQVVDLNPSNTDALSRALDNYESGIKQLDNQLEGLDTSGGNAGKLISDTASQAVKYQELLEELKASHGDAADKIETVQTKIDGLIQGLIAKDNAPGNVRNLLDNAINSQRDDLGRELKALPFLDRLEKSTDDPGIRAELNQAQDNAVLRFEGRFGADGLTPDAVAKILDQLPMTDPVKLNVVDDLRDYINSAAVLSELDIARNALVDKLSSGSAISAGDVSDLINRVTKLIADTESEIQSRGAAYKIPANVKVLIDNAKSLLDKTKNDLQAGRFGAAFGGANAAWHLIMNINRNLSSEENSADTISSLNDKLTRLEGMADDQGLSSDSNPKVFDYFNQAHTVLSQNNPSKQDLQNVEVTLLEANTALKRSGEGQPSLLVPVPGAKSLESTQNKNPVSGSSSTTSNTPAAKSEFCTEQYEPVCGVDGNTYSNRCFADQAGVGVNYKGECKPASGQPQGGKVEKQTNN